MEDYRRIFAFILSPTVVIVCVLVLLSTGNVKVNLLMLGLLLLFVYIPFLTFGIPAVNILERNGRLSFCSLAVVGGVVGSLSFMCLGVALSKILDSEYTVAMFAKEMAFGAGIGVATSTVFSFIANLPFLRR